MALDGLKFVIEEEAAPQTKIRVFGVGGGGSNAVARMQMEGVTGVDFCVLNTDAQALAHSSVSSKLQIGSKITGGLGAGSDPGVGRQAALEDTEKIIDMLEGSHMVFVTAGLGGGTGTGAAPVVASLARELGALTVAVVTKPFAFEGPKRRKQAEQGLAELASVVDTIITIQNDQLLSLVPKGTSFSEAFRVADDVLHQAVQGIADIITTPGLINRDFSDIRAIMQGMGYAMLGTATASGEDAAVVAAQKAIQSPLMEEGGVKGARGILINIAGSESLGLHEVNEACELIRTAAENDDVQIHFGVVVNPDMGDEVKVTVIATGFTRETLPTIQRKSKAADPLPQVEVTVNIAQPAFVLEQQAAASAAIPEAEDTYSGPAFVEDEEEAPYGLREAETQALDFHEPPPLAEEEPARAMAAAAPSGETLFDDLEMPAILRRNRS